MKRWQLLLPEPKRISRERWPSAPGDWKRILSGDRSETYLRAMQPLLRARLRARTDASHPGNRNSDGNLEAWSLRDCVAWGRSSERCRPRAACTFSRTEIQRLSIG